MLLAVFDGWDGGHYVLTGVVAPQSRTCHRYYDDRNSGRKGWSEVKNQIHGCREVASDVCRQCRVWR